jgi:hypothetical protein
MIDITLTDRVREKPADELYPWLFGWLSASVEGFLSGATNLEVFKTDFEDLMVAYLNRVSPIASGNVSPPAAPEEAADRA